MIRLGSDHLNNLFESILIRLNDEFADFQWASPQSFFYRGCGDCIISVGYDSLYENSKLVYRAYAFTGVCGLESFSSFFESPCDAVLDAVRSLLNKMKLSEV